MAEKTRRKTIYILYVIVRCRERYMIYIYILYKCVHNYKNNAICNISRKLKTTKHIHTQKDTHKQTHTKKEIYVFNEINPTNSGV